MLIAFFALGIVLCAVLSGMLVRRYHLPWRQALVYFGLAPYPGEDRTQLRVR